MVGTMHNEENSNTEANIMHMYLNLRPGHEMLRKCYNHLQSTIARHEDAIVDIAGLTTSDESITLTLAVNLGARENLPQFKEPALSGYGFVRAVFEEMFEFLPAYTDEPSEDARFAAETFLARFADETPAANVVNG